METNYNKLLYEKMQAENETFKDWLLSQEPAEILNHAYEYTIYQDMMLCMEDMDLSPKQATLIDDRTHLRKISRTKMSDDELSKVKGQIVSISGKIRELRKEVWLCDDIAERSKVMEQNLETIRAEEEKQERKEQNRYDKRR